MWNSVSTEKSRKRWPMEIGNIFFIFEKNSIHPCKRIYCDRYKVIVFIKQCATKIIRYSSGLTLGEKNKYFYTVMCVCGNVSPPVCLAALTQYNRLFFNILFSRTISTRASWLLCDFAYTPLTCTRYLCVRTLMNWLKITYKVYNIIMFRNITINIINYVYLCVCGKQ